MSNTDNQKLPVTYTAEQVSKVIHRSIQTTRKLMSTGKIPSVKIGNQYLVTKETLDKLLRGEISTEDEENNR